MSMDPGMMQALLAQRLQQSPQGQSYGGGFGGPQMQPRSNPLTAGGDIAQKLMLIKALQQQPRGALPTQAPPQANPMAQPQMMGSTQVQPQIPQAQQMPGGVNA